MIDQIVAATEDFRQIKAQNASYKQGKNYLMQLVFENRKTIKNNLKIIKKNDNIIL